MVVAGVSVNVESLGEDLSFFKNSPKLKEKELVVGSSKNKLSKFIMEVYYLPIVLKLLSKCFSTIFFHPGNVLLKTHFLLFLAIIANVSLIINKK